MSSKKKGEENEDGRGGKTKRYPMQRESFGRLADWGGDLIRTRAVLCTRHGLAILGFDLELDAVDAEFVRRHPSPAFSDQTKGISAQLLVATRARVSRESQARPWLRIAVEGRTCPSPIWSCHGHEGRAPHLIWA